MHTRTHELVSDVPEKLGGRDEGADPHEFLEAALVGCTVITVQMYAKRKGWNLVSTIVTVKIEKEGPETVIGRDVQFVGELDETQRAKLLEIADKCPIHRLLASKISVITRVTPESAPASTPPASSEGQAT